MPWGWPFHHIPELAEAKRSGTRGVNQGRRRGITKSAKPKRKR